LTLTGSSLSTLEGSFYLLNHSLFLFVVIIIIFFFMISLLFPVLSYSNPLHFSILSFFICPQSFPFEGRIEFQTGSKDESDETVLSHEELTLSLLFVS